MLYTNIINAGLSVTKPGLSSDAKFSSETKDQRIEKSQNVRCGKCKNVVIFFLLFLLCAHLVEGIGFGQHKNRSF